MPDLSNTGETVETRGGNHKILKAWKSEYNLANIDEWLVAVKDQAFFLRGRKVGTDVPACSLDCETLVIGT